VIGGKARRSWEKENGDHPPKTIISETDGERNAERVWRMQGEGAIAAIAVAPIDRHKREQKPQVIRNGKKCMRGGKTSFLADAKKKVTRATTRDGIGCCAPFVLLVRTVKVKAPKQPHSTSGVGSKSKKKKGVVWCGVVCAERKAKIRDGATVST
jgi:hypothetical protein